MSRHVDKLIDPMHFVLRVKAGWLLGSLKVPSWQETTARTVHARVSLFWLTQSPRTACRMCFQFTPFNIHNVPNTIKTQNNPQSIRRDSSLGINRNISKAWNDLTIKLNGVKPNERVVKCSWVKCSWVKFKWDELKCQQVRWSGVKCNWVKCSWVKCSWVKCSWVKFKWDELKCKQLRWSGVKCSWVKCSWVKFKWDELKCQQVKWSEV
jgi:hypothetical protein